MTDEACFELMIEKLNKKKEESNFIDEFRSSIMGWYDKYRRDLPWRARAGHQANPYHVWLSEIMLQQTTVPTVIPYFQKFLNIWPTIKDLADAENDLIMQEWAGLGYYARARNLHKCAKEVVKMHDGIFPDRLNELKKLPGIGDYTAAAIVSIAYNKPSVVVDGNIERIISRIFAINTPLPKGKIQIKERAAFLSENRCDRPSDYAQALMDLGSAVCVPRRPKCDICPVRSLCLAYGEGHVEKYPLKAQKKIKPKRYGAVYMITDSKGMVLIEKRPEKGLLGGMIGFPTSEWCEERDVKYIQPFDLKYIDSGLVIKHVFTHFELNLKIKHIEIDSLDDLNLDDKHDKYKISELSDIGFPTLFKKALKAFYND